MSAFAELKQTYTLRISNLELQNSLWFLRSAVNHNYSAISAIFRQENFILQAAFSVISEVFWSKIRFIGIRRASWIPVPDNRTRG